MASHELPEFGNAEASTCAPFPKFVVVILRGAGRRVGTATVMPGKIHVKVSRDNAGGSFGGILLQALTNREGEFDIDLSQWTLTTSGKITTWGPGAGIDFAPKTGEEPAFGLIMGEMRNRKARGVQFIRAVEQASGQPIPIVDVPFLDKSAKIALAVFVGVAVLGIVGAIIYRLLYGLRCP